MGDITAAILFPQKIGRTSLRPMAQYSFRLQPNVLELGFAQKVITITTSVYIGLLLGATMIMLIVFI